MDQNNKIKVALFICIGLPLLFNSITTAKKDVGRGINQQEGQVDVFSRGSSCAVAFWESKL